MVSLADERNMSMDNWYNDPDGKNNKSLQSPSRRHNVHQKPHKDWPGIETGRPPCGRMRVINEKAAPVGYFTVTNLCFPRASKRKPNTSRKMVDVLAKNWTRNHMNTKQKL
jgi:hypothetical protein